MNIIFKLLKFLKLFYNSKKYWKGPFYKKIIIYDCHGANDLIKYLPKNETFILHTRGEKINLRIFILSLVKFNFSWSYKRYLLLYIKSINPKCIITFIDNNLNFYRLKKIFPNVVFISVQNGVRGYDNDVFKILKEKKEDFSNLYVDQMFVWNDQTAKNYNQYINGNFNVIGSFKNNYFENKTSYKEYDILFISEYRKKKDFNKKLTWENFFNVEKKLLPYLYKYCQSNNLNFYISSNSFDFEEENNFYRDIINGTDWRLLKRENDYSSYNNIDKSKLVVFISSSLGYEALSRGSKTAALTVRSISTKIKSHRFGWPYQFSDDVGDIWTNKLDFSKIEIILNNLNNMPHKDYGILIKSKYDYILPYDQNNQIFKSKTKDIFY